MSDSTTLRILLRDQPVGLLTMDIQERSEFRLLESYKNAWPRPILGQVFIDDPDRVHRSRSRLTPWFSNLLPEGPLRDFIAQQAGVSPVREFHLLRHLGEDLPGAVRIIPEELNNDFMGSEITASVQESPADPYHFSLAGVQLKFSAQQGERGLTVPVTGRGGNWIVKLPDARYPLVPENECSTMRWAEASGIQIPEIELVRVEGISGLPESIGSYGEQQALAVRRFDRTEQGERIHMEDFAQILSLYPEEKYAKYNYETLAKLILVLAGKEGLEEFLQRLVFILASGNGDAHHKNWTLLYPDGRNAELSPAYDLVSTIQYMNHDKLALNMAKSKQWRAIDMAAFIRMAAKIDVDKDWMVDRVEQSAKRILNAWNGADDGFGFSTTARKKINHHLQNIPIF
jgi:serine/threonine-protein kinase HipA